MSLGIDLGLGQPMEHMLRSCLLAQELARELGVDRPGRARIYYASLLAWIGCHADSHELAALFGDDIAFRAATYRIDNRGPRLAAMMVGHAGSQLPVLPQMAAKARFLAAGRGSVEQLIASHCRSAGILAEGIGLPERVRPLLAHTFERWDGRGLPTGAAGRSIPLEMRVVHVADVVEIHARSGGMEAGQQVARARSGTQFDPEVVEALFAVARIPGPWSDDSDPWPAVLRAAPEEKPLDQAAFDAVLAAIGDFADLKSPFTAGHSRAVAALAERAAGEFGLPEAETHLLRRAGWVHDVGRLGVSNAIWDKETALTAVEVERMHQHPYLSGRIVERIPGGHRLAGLAAAHHERLDGSGYPRGTSAAGLDVDQRILAAADAYCTSREPRPHRPAATATAAAARLERASSAGTLDGDAVASVLSAVGQGAAAGAETGGALTSRELEVLRLVCRGLNGRAMAAELVLSPKTVRNHVEHIYRKIGANNRVGATLYALDHGLLGWPSD